MEKSLSRRPSTIDCAILYLSWFALFFVIFASSWVSEDAYISFRVIDNFAHDYGLRWNVHERVQAYTHPLWLLLHLPFALFVENLFLLNMALSLVCSSAAVAVVLLTFRKSTGVVLGCFMLPLFLSKTFRDYSTSGLETSLSFLLFALLGYVLVHFRERKYFWFLLSLSSSLLLLNRLDHALLIAPLFAYLTWQHFFSPPACGGTKEGDGSAITNFSAKNHPHHSTKILQVQNLSSIASPASGGGIVMGMLPLIAWFAFSLLYYGFLFPNTKYAKLDTGFPLVTYLTQGAHYYFIWLTHDTQSVLVVAAALFFSLSTKHQALSIKMLALGIVVNLVYVLTIGGDYMMGRFFAFPFFVSCWLLLAVMPDKLRPDIIIASSMLLVTAFLATYFMRDIRTMCPSCIPVVGKVIDARRSFGANALFIDVKWPFRIRTEGQYKFARDGKKMATEEPPPLKPLRYIGMSAYYAGPRAIFIDELALADALMARLPAITNREFYVGHYRRYVPKGYLEAVRTGSTKDMQPDLAKYYEKLRIITQGELWEGERLMTILRFNFGQYEPYRYAFLHPPKPR